MKDQNLINLADIMCKAMERAYGLDVKEYLNIEGEDWDYLLGSVDVVVTIDGQDISFWLGTPDGKQYVLNVMPEKGCNDLSVVDQYIDAFLASPEGAAFDVNTAVESEDDYLILAYWFAASSEEEAIEAVCSALKTVDINNRPKLLNDLLNLFR